MALTPNRPNQGPVSPAADVEVLELPAHWGWVLALGIVMVLLGMFGIVFAVTLTVVSVLVFGALAIVGGLFQLWYGLAHGKDRWRGRILHLFIGLVYLLFGGLLVWDPLAGSISLTLLLAVFLIALGVTRLLYAWRSRRSGWRWKLATFAGLLNFVLAAVILYGWPATGFWVIGLIIAIEMIINGWMLIAMAWTARSLQRDPASGRVAAE